MPHRHFPILKGHSNKRSTDTVDKPTLGILGLGVVGLLIFFGIMLVSSPLWPIGVAFFGLAALLVLPCLILIYKPELLPTIYKLELSPTLWTGITQALSRAWQWFTHPDHRNSIRDSIFQAYALLAILLGIGLLSGSFVALLAFNLPGVSAVMLFASLLSCLSIVSLGGFCGYLDKSAKKRSPTQSSGKDENTPSTDATLLHLMDAKPTKPDAEQTGCITAERDFRKDRVLVQRVKSVLQHMSG